jgi:GNAT superfamily N-acetyltransferase
VTVTMRIATRVRDAAAADYKAWRRLWDQYLASLGAMVAEEVTMTTWSRIVDQARPDLFARLAERDGQVVGFAVCVLHPGTWTIAPICYLEDLCVDEVARGAGVGHALIEDLLALANDRGWSRLYWHTGAGNAAARRLYDRFVPVDDVVRYRIYLS